MRSLRPIFRLGVAALVVALAWAREAKAATATTAEKVAAISPSEQPAPPQITSQPQSLTVNDGTAVHFKVSATGSPAPTYQWYVNGTPFSGATSATLDFSDARGNDAGVYSVLVTNPLGKVMSRPATLSVSVTPAPAAAGSSTPIHRASRIALFLCAAILLIILILLALPRPARLTSIFLHFG